MATPSPYNFDQRKPKIPSLKFASAEDYAKHHAALKSGQLGHNGTYITGANRGKTPDQAYAYELEQGAAEGYPLRNPENAARRSLGLPGRDAGIDEGMTRTASNTNTGMSGAAPTQPAPTTSPTSLKSPFPSVTAKASAGKNSTMRSFSGGSGSPGAIQTPPAAATPAQPNQSAVSAPQLEAQVRAQGFEMQNAGITQRGTDGSVLYNNGASISPTSPTGGRVLTHPRGIGSVTMGPSKTKSFDGMSPAQFGAAAAARQGVGNRFVPTPPRLGQPAVAAPATPGPAQQRQADFTASNPPTLTDQQINQKQQTFQANRDNLAAIQAQKASAAGTPRPVSPGSPPLANAAGQTGNLLAKLTQPKPSLAPLLSSPATPPLRAGYAAAPPPSLSSRSKSAITAAVAAAPKPQPIPDEYYRSLPMEAVKGTVNLAKNAFGAVQHAGEKIAEQFDTSFIHQPTPIPARTPAPVKTGPWVALPPGISARAAGGPVQGGQPYLVGEQGPEIVVPGQSGTVIPNHQIPSLRQPVQPAQPRKTTRPTASVVPVKPPSLLATFG